MEQESDYWVYVQENLYGDDDASYWQTLADHFEEEYGIFEKYLYTECE